MVKKIFQLKIILSVISVALILLGVFLSIQSEQVKNDPNYTMAVARISRINRVNVGNEHMNHTVYVDFVHQGNSYKDINLGYYDNSMVEGLYIRIYVNIDNPYNITVRAANISSFIPILVGAFFLGVAFLTDKLAGYPNEKKRALMPGVVFVLIALFFAPFALPKYFDDNNYTRIQADITNIVTTPNIINNKPTLETVVYVDYTYDNVYYKNIPLPYYESSMLKMDKTEIVVDRRNPYRIEVHTSKMVTVVFGIFSGCFLVIGLLLMGKNAETSPLSSWMYNPAPMYRWFGGIMMGLGVTAGIYGLINPNSVIFSSAQVQTSTNGTAAISTTGTILYISFFLILLGGIFFTVGHLFIKQSRKRNKKVTDL
ncbi:hypothetical protein [Lacrimispora brassicae]